ncbi:MAG: hypothetical protein IPG12_11005 [Saprospiraceae bacterium]|nr:hypothetical protein [Saprospiraceae bacterium]
MAKSNQNNIKDTDKTTPKRQTVNSILTYNPKLPTFQDPPTPPLKKD